MTASSPPIPLGLRLYRLLNGEDPVWSAVFDRVTLTFVGLVTVLVWFKAGRVLGPAAELWLHRVDAALTVVLTVKMSFGLLSPGMIRRLQSDVGPGWPRPCRSSTFARVDMLPHVLAPEYVGHVNAHDIVGAEAATGFISGFLAGIPDAFYAVHETLEADDRVICRWTCTGTQTGNFYGIPATGKKIDVKGITIFPIAHGQIAELWNVWDQFALVQQLNA